MGDKQPTILVCDDSLLIRKRMAESLQTCGNFKIVEAASGQAAIDMFKQHRPQLVFLDIVMPDKSGLEALKEIMEIDKDAKVVMVSSSGTRTHLKAAMEAGAADFIQKPWEQSQLAHIVKNIFE